MSGYKQRTEHLGIPVPGHKDTISHEIELRKYTIIENMLLAGTMGMSEVVFDEGTYLLNNQGEEFSVRLLAAGSSPSAHGIVGGYYFRAAPEIEWSGLKDGYKYYLYLREMPDTAYRKSRVSVISSNHRLSSGLLMASVDLREEVPEINVNPDGKVYSSDVGRHASDCYNPHGISLIQDEMKILKKLSLDNNASVNVHGEDISPEDFLESLSHIRGKRTKVIDFESGGEDGVVISTDGCVEYVFVSMRYGKEKFGAGEIVVGYFGEDDRLDSSSEFSVYNSGKSEMPMRAIIFTREVNDLVEQ